MKFHVYGLPHSQTTARFSADAFEEKVRKFCNMMHDLGHQVILYAGDQNEARVTELVTLFTETERLEALGGRHYSAASWDSETLPWTRFNTRAIEATRERLQPGDFLCFIAGVAHKPIADAFHGYRAVEFGIGYAGTFAPHRVWESLAWMHTVYGAQSGRPESARGFFFDEVIPGYFEPDLFPFRAEKDDYFLFVGRMTELKGPHVASQICDILGVPLILAGPGDLRVPYGEYVGEVGPERRGELMAGAKALIMPTLYLEPFGNVAVEAQASGTPVISTPWGAMTETVLHGKTGYHCHTLGDFLDACSPERLLELWRPEAIRSRVIETYSVDVVAQKYDRYFQRLSLLDTPEGWNAARSFL